MKTCLLIVLLTVTGTLFAQQSEDQDPPAGPTAEECMEWLEREQPEGEGEDGERTAPPEGCDRFDTETEVPTEEPGSDEAEESDEESDPDDEDFTPDEEISEDYPVPLPSDI